MVMWDDRNFVLYFFAPFLSLHYSPLNEGTDHVGESPVQVQKKRSWDLRDLQS
jgi:hypothetical protein